MPDQPPTQSLHARVISGLGWKAFSQISVQVLALVTTIFIAHLLTPSEVGLVAMATVFSALALVFADLALGAALVQRETLTEEDRSTAFWLNVAVGVVLTVAGVALAGPIANLYGEPEVKSIFQVVSITFLLTTLGTTQGSLLIREMRFRSLEVRTVIASAAASAVAITLAFLDYGVWAIVGQKLTITGLSTALLWRASSWRPQLVFSRESARELFGFSGFLVGSRLLSYLERNADNYLVGRYAGSAALGAYSIAYNVMLVPLTRLAAPVQQVFYPALSKIRDAARVGAAWLRATRMVAVITIPAFAGMAVVASDFVTVVLGDQWEQSVPVLQILCWVGIIQSVGWQAGAVLQALDRTSWLFRYAIISTAVVVAAFAIGVHWGVVGVAAGYAIATTALAPFYLRMPLRATGMSALRLFSAVSGAAQASAVMAAALLALRFLALESLSPGLRLAISIAAGVAVYLPLCAWRCPEAIEEIRRVWERRLRPPQPGIPGPG